MRNILKGLLISIGISLLLTGLLTNFHYYRLAYQNVPYPPNPPVNYSINAWLFCLLITICCFFIIELIKRIRKLRNG